MEPNCLHQELSKIYEAISGKLVYRLHVDVWGGHMASREPAVVRPHLRCMQAGKWLRCAMLILGM